MRFLADESCDFAEVRTLGAEGHVVTGVGEAALGTSDERVVAMAIREGAVHVLVAAADTGATPMGAVVIRRSGRICDARAPIQKLP